MAKVTIYHNPRCSKSRQTLQLLHDHNIDTKVIEYLKTPPNTQELERILQLLNFTPRDLLRRKEHIYKELNLSNPKLTDNEIIKIMQENPILIERPIVVTASKAVIGRPPENVLEII